MIIRVARVIRVSTLSFIPTLNGDRFGQIFDFRVQSFELGAVLLGLLLRSQCHLNKERERVNK